MQDTNKTLSEYQLVIKNLKKILKDLKFSYKDIAVEIGLSESGVKKIFLAQDGSFQRISQICNLVGVSLLELLEDSRTFEVNFNKKQQDEFIKDSILFRIYWALVYERKTLDFVQQDLNLDKKDTFRRLRKLDSLHLLKLLPHDRLQLPSIQAVRWSGTGEFMDKIYRESSRHLLESVAKTRTEPDEVFRLRYLPMTEKTYSEFQSALSSLDDEFTRRSIHELRTKASETKPVRWMTVADNRRYFSNT